MLDNKRVNISHDLNTKLNLNQSDTQTNTMWKNLLSNVTPGQFDSTLQRSHHIPQTGLQILNPGFPIPQFPQSDLYITFLRLTLLSHRIGLSDVVQGFLCGINAEF